MQSDKGKLKQLLKKAKDAIDSLNAKYKQSQEALRLQQARNAEVIRTVEVMQSRRNGVADGEVVRVACRLKVDGKGYALVEKVDGELAWY